ncbi:MAG: hypothetical protein AUK28_04220 [Desulfobacterales bacterium CG2_30_60_27]|nr:MAG: hypothetical protein AUK28_04220 [Desulfobacterales bacterium CG2_30_60_27]
MKKHLAVLLWVTLGTAVGIAPAWAGKPSGGGGGGGGSTIPPKNAFNILMNYELGMHCTGFEFSYCCILPPYNSILAQVVKTEKTSGKPSLMEADDTDGLDALGRPTVVRDKALDSNGNFKKYVLRYWHDAQPRNDGRGAPQSSTLISQVEGHSLLMWNTVQDSVALNANGAIIYDANGVAQGDGDFTGPTDNYANAWLNHLYIYADLEGSNPTNSTLERNKIRLGVAGGVVYPPNTGAALHPMGPGVTGGIPGSNTLTFSGDKGTVVYTQMKVLENLPITLTSAGIWEALGLPLTPFEDTINFFGDPGAVDEDTIRPYVIMRAQLEDYATGAAILDNGQPVQGMGTAPIDIPNCERCHGITSITAVNSAQRNNQSIVPFVQEEIDFWKAYYNIDTAAGDSDWYPRIKGAAISILAIHDAQHGTSFTANWPVLGGASPQKTRLGGPSIICQRCHADNVIAAVKSAYNPANGSLIMPLTEAIHNNHKNNQFADSLGRDGSCQGCHPAHRSDGSMASFPIDHLGNNNFANGDNRDSFGGCYVGRDVHINPNKDTDGAGTPSHLNAMGNWLVTNVAQDTGAWKGIWCTNCHSQFGQELWKKENVTDLVHAKPGDAGNVREPKANATLADVAAGIGVTTAQATAWLDPKTTADTFAVWARDPGLCGHVATLFGAPANPAQDGNVATIEVNLTAAGNCSTPVGAPGPDCDGNGSPDFFICGSADGDGDFSVHILDFCTTGDCVSAAQATLHTGGAAAVPVPMSAATDGRDHWLAPGEPHCADCHAAPYVEQSGNISNNPPFNYPKKASLFRYTKGHQGITCQGCHESTHGLYPVTPTIDTTTYAQAASLNTDSSHGPLKCNACHNATANGVEKSVGNLTYNGTSIGTDFDAAVSWAHTYTDEADPRTSICLRCHGDNSSKISSTDGKWTTHAKSGRVSRNAMDKVEKLQLGHVAGDQAFENPYTTLCVTCHSNRQATLKKKGCTTRWKKHLVEGRASESVWEAISKENTGSTCGY